MVVKFDEKLDLEKNVRIGFYVEKMVFNCVYFYTILINKKKVTTSPNNYTLEQAVVLRMKYQNSSIKIFFQL